MDKFSALWLSHSRINVFKKCPRAYYLSYLYRDPRTNHKVSLITPSMSLGSAVHSVLESLSSLPVAKRFETSLIERLDQAWLRVAGRLGGFQDPETEAHFKAKGQEMLRRIMSHPGPLQEKAVKIKMDLPSYWLSEEDNLVLCGKLDWLEYLPATDQVHIIDFKTGGGEEAVDSLQLPIYLLLATNCQTREVARASYWYLSRDDYPVEQKLPSLDKSRDLVLKAGKEIKLATSLDRFKCPTDGCKTCLPYEKILAGDAEFVGVGDYNTDLYALFEGQSSSLPESEIL